MTVVISGVWLRRLQLPGERDDIVVRGDAGEPEPRVERDRAGVAHLGGQVQAGDAACLQCRDEGFDEFAAEALRWAPLRSLVAEPAGAAASATGSSTGFWGRRRETASVAGATCAG